MAYKDTKRSSDYMKFFWNVSKPVGSSMINRSSDVALVQTLLRLSYDCSFVATLPITGVCDHQTREAIRKFQREFSGYSVKAGFGALEADGIVSHADNFGFDGPGGKTIAYTIVALNFCVSRFHKVKWENLCYDPDVPIYLRMELLKAAA